MLHFLFADGRGQSVGKAQLACFVVKCSLNSLDNRRRRISSRKIRKSIKRSRRTTRRRRRRRRWWRRRRRRWRTRRGRRRGKTRKDHVCFDYARLKLFMSQHRPGPGSHRPISVETRKHGRINCCFCTLPCAPDRYTVSGQSAGGKPRTQPLVSGQRHIGA